ncbi:cilium assembly protein DZIP1 isoform X2 [Cataglyphis hispanica]|uniref:cilium assembly protein DZIP1 isoform X2 n=1 Tax=Cataglyphis hispanica TaxID=1086592 RepID=UPI00217FFA4E|nr:cilium assembly protein DZIP1 isoform X2 [Cataglyphis hispanica]
MAFSFRAGTNWCHDFPKLARESGFYFNMHGSRARVDWNRAIDIDRVIRERDFLTIDENINNVIDYSLESEYDIKILDSNFVKLFRLAQLSVEYLLYCKQYLDHSVIILKDELRQKIEQNVNMKKKIAALEDTIKSLRDKSKEKRKLIEATVGEISNGEIFKCPHCPKTFVRAIFVNAHIARKHSCISDMSVATCSPVHEHYRVETEKLHNEIKTLKERLNQTERVIRNESDKLLDNTEDFMRNNTGKLNRFQEQKKYQEDIESLKNMLFDEIRALREKDHIVNESILETNIKTLISQQEKEIDSLRNQLLERLTPGIENMQVKLQTQENYWKAKIEDMEAQHRRDIERLTTELKTTQQIADHIKSECASKVHDLEKQSMDQSNMLVEQRKQLNNLSREINNSQTQINNYRSRENDIVEEFHKSPVLKIKRDSNYNDAETDYKSLNSIGNPKIIIENVDSESSQEYRDKPISITAQNIHVPNKNDSIKNKDNRNPITNCSKNEDHTIKCNLKNTERTEVVRKLKNKAKNNTLNDVNKINGCTNKCFTTKQNNPVNVNKKYSDITNVEKEKTSHSDDIGNDKKSEFLEKHSVSSMTESESSSLMLESGSDSESVTTDDDITVKKYETSIVNSSDTRKLIQEDAQSMLDKRLKDLGIDPEWQGIPAATFKQKMEIVRHQQNINAKKLVRYNQIKQKILEDVLQRISINHKKSKCSMPVKNSPLNKPVKSKAWKAFSNHRDSDEYIFTQKTENTTPSKLHLKQKIELLPKRYKDDEMYENTREPSKRNETDVYTSPKVTLAYPKLIRNISSASSIESCEDVKQIPSTKITMSDTSVRSISSPFDRKQVVPKFFGNDSDSTIIQQDASILSPKNSKSVLKPMSGSVGSLVKKKVLFDLDDRKNDTTMLETDQRKGQMSNNDWSISSPERREYGLQKEKSMSTSNIILKTSQSDKIAEISKKIQEQLSIARKPPAGSVETIFRSNTNLQNLTNDNTEDDLLKSISLTSSISDPGQDVTSSKTKDSVFPQPAPRTLKDKDLSIAQCRSELKYSDLDSDIDEILQMS